MRCVSVRVIVAELSDTSIDAPSSRSVCPPAPPLLMSIPPSAPSPASTYSLNRRTATPVDRSIDWPVSAGGSVSLIKEPSETSDAGGRALPPMSNSDEEPSETRQALALWTHRPS